MIAVYHPVSRDIVEIYCRKYDCQPVELFAKVFDTQNAIRAGLELYIEDGIIPYKVRDYIRENL